MFDAAITYIRKYRQQREEALVNKKRQRWFTGDTTDLAKLLGDTFGSETENSDWESLTATPTGDFKRLQAVRLKIAFLSGWRHDLRSQFAVGKEHDSKTVLDFDRHAINDIRAAQYRLDILEKAIKIKDAGAISI